MNSKIDGYSAASAASSLLRTPVKSAGSGSASEAASVAPVTRVDSVKLTGNAVQLQQSEQSLGADSSSAARSSRVAQLKQAVSSGSYSVDAQAVSDKLLRMDWQLGTSR